MTQEEKAKVYDEALERFKAFKEKYYIRDTYLGDAIFDKTGGMQKDFESIFPELSESEDENTRKALIEVLHRLPTSAFECGAEGGYLGATKEQMLAYLEKQKERKPDVKDTFDDEQFCRGYEAGIHDAMREQKPVEYLPTEKVYAIMTKLTELSTSNLIPINSYEYKKIHGITSDVRSLLDYPIEQKPAEWSEYDNLMITLITSALNDLEEIRKTKGNDKTPGQYQTEKAWLKSLCSKHHWKPTEKQMEALNAINCHGGLSYVGQQNQLISLYNDLKKLM